MQPNNSNIYIDKSAANIRLSVVDGELEIGQFNVLKQGQIVSDRPQFRIKMRIIGASHLLSFEMGSHIFHEIFACGDIKINTQKIAALETISANSESVKLDLWDKVSYFFKPALLSYSKAEKWLRELEIRAKKLSESDNDMDVGLVFNFPCGKSLHKTPKTILIAQCDKSSAQVKITTAHSYPNEERIVQSDSILKFS